MSGTKPAPQGQPTPIRATPDVGTEHRRQPVPVPPGRLFGRDADIAAVTGLLLDEDVRLVTLTGPGGVGKTRLALELAGRVVSHFGGLVTFVSLAPLTDPARVLPAIAQALELPDAIDDRIGELIAAEFDGIRHLLVLDNFEHVAAAGPSVSALAQQCPRLTVLITSRLRLRLQGEHEYPVLPLLIPESLPAVDPDPATLGANPAVALFVQRAVAAKPDFALTAANGAAVGELCRRLDGLPLAIELAAARSGMLSPQSMLARLSGRLQLLSDGPVDAPPRLRTMRDAVAWSLDLLPPDAATLFRRLGVFAGSFSVESAEAIAGDIAVVPALGALVDAALLLPAPGFETSTRYRMLEPIREIARERLEDAGEADETRLQMAEGLRRTIREIGAGIQADGKERWFPFLAVEEDNFSASIDWATRAGRPDLSIALINGPLWFYWAMLGRTRSERPRLEEALNAAATADPPASPISRIQGLFTDGLYHFHTGDYARARARYEEVLVLSKELPDPDVVSLPPLSNLAVLDIDQGRYAEAQERLEAVLAIRRRIGDPSDTARTLVNLGNVALHQGNVTAARRIAGEALELLRQTGGKRIMAHCLALLGEIAVEEGNDAEALIAYDQAIGLFRQDGDIIVEGLTLANLAAAALRQGDAPRAAAALGEVLQQQEDAKTPIVVADALDGAAAVALATGRARQAPELLAVAAGIRSVSRIVPVPAVRRRTDRAVGAAKAALGRSGFDAATAVAQIVTVDGAMARAARLLAELAPEPLDAAPANASVLVALPDRAAAPPVALTKRQRDVLLLLVAGSTDPEIAEELGIGVRTVESHVAAILDKLRVHARTAAVAYAVRHGLG